MTEYRITDLKYENKNSYKRIYINEKKQLRKEKTLETEYINREKLKNSYRNSKRSLMKIKQNSLYLSKILKPG